MRAGVLGPLLAEGADGHCEGMAPIVFWTAAFDWLDGVGKG